MWSRIVSWRQAPSTEWIDFIYNNRQNRRTWSTTNIDQHWTEIRRREGILLFTSLRKSLASRNSLVNESPMLMEEKFIWTKWDIHLKLKWKDHTHSLALSLFSIQRTPYRCHWSIGNNWPARNLEHLALSCLKSECDWSMTVSYTHLTLPTKRIV